jgi:ABC-2 type transport system ATP-binding protein
MVVSIRNLTKRYGDLTALDDFSLGIGEGEVFGLLGPNGSGKTTAINCMLSLLKYERGTVELFGRPMQPDAYDIKRDIGIVMQNVAVFDELTVAENVDYFCGLYIADKRTRRPLVDEAIAATGLSEFRKFYPKKLSGGLLRRLNIACGIVHKPKLIVMDEPTVGVDPQSRNNILEGILKLNAGGATVLYTSHYMEEVEQICSRIAIMDRGRVIALGTNAELKNMAGAGEKITVEVFSADRGFLAGLREMPSVISAECANGTLLVKSARGGNSLLGVLDHLKSRGVAFGKVFSELPTLNDVFLEITGKNLRDEG